VWITCGDEAMLAEDELASGKLRFVFRFAGAFVGSTVVTGKQVVGFGVGCGKKSVNFCETGAATVGGILRRVVPTKERIGDRLGEGAPSMEPVQEGEAMPIAIEAEQPAQPVASVQDAPVEEPAQPVVLVPVEEIPVEEPAQPVAPVEEVPVEEPAQPVAPVEEVPVEERAQPVAPVEEVPVEEPAQPVAPVEEVPVQELPDPQVPDVLEPTPVKADPEPIKPNGSEPQVSHAKEPIYSDVTPEEINAARFTGAAQKLLFTRALSDLAHEDVIRRTHAAKAIGRIRNELSVRMLAAHIVGEPSAQVRKECVNALVALDMKEGLPGVEHALNDNDKGVRLAAIMGVYRMAGVTGASTLLGMLHDENAEVRRVVACCIGWTGQEHRAVELVPLLSDEAVQVRRAAVEAMGSLGDRRVVSALIKCLNDTDDSVRRKASEAVEQITGKRMSERYPENDEGRERLLARWRHWWNGQAAR